MSLRRWVGDSKNLKTPLRNTKMAPSPVSSTPIKYFVETIIDNAITCSNNQVRKKEGKVEKKLCLSNTKWNKKIVY